MARAETSPLLTMSVQQSFQLEFQATFLLHLPPHLLQLCRFLPTDGCHYSGLALPGTNSRLCFARLGTAPSSTHDPPTSINGGVRFGWAVFLQRPLHGSVPQDWCSRAVFRTLVNVIASSAIRRGNYLPAFALLPRKANLEEQSGKGRVRLRRRLKRAEES